MASFPFAPKFFIVGLLAIATSAVPSQGGFVPEGTEYAIAGTLPGEQVYPHASIKPGGGYLVWHDNITDGEGYGISARKLDSSLSGTLSVFRVNQNGAEDQERPVVSLLNAGGAAFVWQGGKQGFHHIYARFLSAAGTWTTGDVAVSSATNVYQLETSAITLTNGNVVVAWSSFNQVSSSSLRDIYFQILTPTGSKFGSETLANQVTAFNQRAAASAALSDGRFILVWVSEQQRFENSADIYARIYSATGTPVGSEFLINPGTNVCANPSVAASPDGGFTVAWAEKDLNVLANSWDIVARPFSANALGGVTRRVNNQTYGDQYSSRIAAQGPDYLVTWTSLGQDGAREGVYARYLQSDGTLSGIEFRVNTTTVSQQMHPTVASDGVARFLTVWSSFVGGAGVFDLYAQRYANTNQPLPAPGAPIVSALSSNTLSVSWPPVSGFSIASYEVFADGAVTATAVVTNTYWNATGLAANSTHSYRLAYVVSDGRRSPLSGNTIGTTYKTGTHGGIPRDWMGYFWGDDSEFWPASFADTDADGVSNKNEFLAGTDPMDANSVLKVRLQPTAQGLFLNWNTEPGLMYQIWSAAAPGGVWSKVGSPRFAAGAIDSLFVGGSAAGFYRIERLR